MPHIIKFQVGNRTLELDVSTREETVREQIESLSDADMNKLLNELDRAIDERHSSWEELIVIRNIFRRLLR